MEYLELFSETDDFDKLKSKIIALGPQLRLSPNRLEFNDASTKGSGKNQSQRFSLSLIEVAYPEDQANQEDPTAAITASSVISYISIKDSAVTITVNNEIFQNLPRPAGAKEGKLAEPWKYLDFADDYNSLLLYIEQIIAFKISHYESSSFFGCCSKFTACSTAGHCLHDNLLYSKGCVYREKLENGENYYRQ